jgi:hypothetical protein
MTCIVLNIWPNVSSWNFVLSFYIIPSWYKTTIKNVQFFKNDVNVEKPIAYMYFCHIYIMWPSIIMHILHHCVWICKIFLKIFISKLKNYIFIFLPTTDFDHNYMGKRWSMKNHFWSPIFFTIMKNCCAYNSTKHQDKKPSWQSFTWCQ